MKMQITVDVSGSVDQTIELHPGHEMTLEEFESRFKKGEIITSVGHGDNNGRVYAFGAAPVGLIEIGKVVAQEALDDMEIVFSEHQPLTSADFG